MGVTRNRNHEHDHYECSYQLYSVYYFSAPSILQGLRNYLLINYDMGQTHIKSNKNLVCMRFLFHHEHIGV
jgi:hypothetical protein